ncbi:MAG TPA: hypothetical protein VLH15_04645 [Dehalococcoidales bacterium]|nr:hypothetical protein [Dehalococcoidales bacterium]
MARLKDPEGGPSLVMLEASNGEAEASGPFFVVILEASNGEAEGSGGGSNPCFLTGITFYNQNVMFKPGCQSYCA